MRFYVNGFTWEARFPLGGGGLPSRAQAIAALERLPFDAPAAAEARAAFSVKDYGYAVECASRGARP